MKITPIAVMRVLISGNLQEKSYRNDIITILSRMKALARSHVWWWPNIERDIEACVRSCECCQAIKQSIPLAPIQPWTWPSETMAKSSRELCGTGRWENALCVDGCSLYMARSVRDNKYNSAKRRSRFFVTSLRPK